VILVVDVGPGSSGAGGFADFVSLGIVLLGVDGAVGIGNGLELALGVVLVD